MGSSLSCLKPQKEGGAVRPVVERRPVSASELQRPASSFTASNSQTMEEKHRHSVDAAQALPPNEEKSSLVESANVKVASAQRLLPTPRTLKNAVTEVEDVEDVEDVKDVEETAEADVGDIRNEEELPNVGSTIDDIGATEHIEKETAELVGLHVRTEKALVTETTLSSLPEKAPILEPMPAIIEDVKAVPPVKKVSKGERGKDRVAKKGLQKVVEVQQKKLELQRSDTMLDVRKTLPVKMHVTNYEKIDAAAKVNDEELVKSGKYKTVEA